MASIDDDLTSMNTLKLEDKEKQTTTIVAEDKRVVIRIPKTNSTKKGSRSCTSCMNTGGKYEQIDSVVAHEIHVSYYRIVNCSVNIEGVVHLSVVSSQHDNNLVSFEGSPLNLSIEQARDFVDELRVKAGEFVLALIDLARSFRTGITRARKLKVLVNPVGGQGKAVRYYNERVFPILRAAGCIIDLQSKWISCSVYFILIW